MRIAFYYPLVIRGGVEVALLNLLKTIHNKVKGDIFVVYTDKRSDHEILDEMSKYASVVRTMPYAEIVVECSIFSQSGIPASYRIQWIHGNAIECKITWKDRIKANTFVAVSEEAARQFGRKPLVFQNELDPDIHSKAKEPIKWDCAGLKLVTVSRIAHMKGFDRMPALCKELERQGVEYEWVVIGRGFSQAYEQTVRESLSDHNVLFLGEKKNPYPWLKAADYCVQLSDAESFGLSTMEAQVLGTPSIITNYTVAKETLSGNAHILEKDMSNVAVIVNRIHQIPPTRTHQGDSAKWIQLLNSVEVTHDMIVKATKKFLDMEESKRTGKQVFRRIGDTWECSKDRGNTLASAGFAAIIEQPTKAKPKKK